MEKEKNLSKDASQINKKERRQIKTRRLGKSTEKEERETAGLEARKRGPEAMDIDDGFVGNKKQRKTSSEVKIIKEVGEEFGEEIDAGQKQTLEKTETDPKVGLVDQSRGAQ